MRVPAEAQQSAEAPRARSSPGRPRASCTRRAGLDWPAMAQTTAVRLTGEDLTHADVWRVAVEGAGTELDDSARKKMAAAREVVELGTRTFDRDSPDVGGGEVLTCEA